ncbi:MAG: hypothetical protein A3G76_13675 [Acidobacteria bacterium RIFCSPLOWO2_12_FULL_65_11]|nr:MAG: hypothetical protein A3H95_11450 [Acidobacteria bacterium RIFCSPLOWO2_02_FULL_64_15]OFW33681.1 MAG: hypothetical protein A3G76_13675 [Acidobacteria bacterium RIFCSPLOWO2_12_FULL_65_11]
MGLTAVLIDDERPARDELGYLLGRISGVEVVGQAENGIEALTAIDRLQPDVVFLDVQMPGLTGLEVARRMLDSRAASHIIFVTAYDRHAIEAFEINAVDYLLKPVDQARLELAVERARKRIEADRGLTRPGLPGREMDVPAARDRGVGVPGVLMTAQLEKIVELVAERQNRRERLAIKVGEKFFLVQADEIVYASLSDDSITVVTNQHTGTSNYRTLDELQARLDGNVFWRVHRSHLVNINKIKEIVPWFSRNYILRMRDQKSSEIPVSRAQTRRLREYLKL